MRYFLFDEFFGLRVYDSYEKTEFYFGKEVADYCRVNNISSLWTHIAKEEDTFYNPWHIK